MCGKMTLVRHMSAISLINKCLESSGYTFIIPQHISKEIGTTRKTPHTSLIVRGAPTKILMSPRYRREENEEKYCGFPRKKA